MAGFFSRLKNWLGYENITNTDLNNEFNNIIQKIGADTISSANSTNGSAPTVAAMQTTLNPGGVGTEVLAQTIQQDVQELRYQLNQIIGGAQWYSQPAQSIASLSAEFSSIANLPAARIISGRIDANDQPMFLVPGDPTNSIILKASATNLVVNIYGVTYTYTADITLSGLTKTTAPGAANNCTLNDANVTGTQSSQLLGERGTNIIINTIGANISALNGQYTSFKLSGLSERFIAEVDTTNNVLRNAWRAIGFDKVDAWTPRTSISNGQVFNLRKLAWIFGTYNSNTPSLDVTYNRPTISYKTPASPSIGDYWFNLSLSKWQKYNGTSFSTTIAVALGIALTNDTLTEIARSFDFYRPVSVLNTVEPYILNTTNLRANRIGSQVSVYGTTFQWPYDYPIWNSATDIDSGTTLSANTTYYFYVTDKGDRFYSFYAPYDRRFDLLGSYLPNKPWRCVAEMTTDGSANFVSTNILFDLYHQDGFPDYFLNPRHINNQSGAAPYVFPANGIQFNSSTGGQLRGFNTSDIGVNNGPYFSTTHGMPSSTARTLALVTNSNTVGYPIVVSATPPTHGLLIVSGFIDTAGNSPGTGSSYGQGWTGTKNSTGDYNVFFVNAFASDPAVVAGSGAGLNTQIGGVSTSVTNLAAFDLSAGSAVPSNVGIWFIAIGERGI